MSVASWALHGVCHVEFFQQNQGKIALYTVVATMHAPTWVSAPNPGHVFGAQ